MCVGGGGGGLLNVPANFPVYLSDGSAQIIVRAAKQIEVID